MDETRQPGVRIAQIFLEQVTFRHRSDHLTIATLPSPEKAIGDVSIQVENGWSQDQKQGLIRVRVQTRPENLPFFEFDIAMAALVMVDEAAPNMPLDRYVTTSGGALLYPFVRQIVAELTWRGRFGPVWLDPVNLTTVKPTSSPEPLPTTQASPSRRRSDGRGTSKRKKKGKRARSRRSP